jgi:hypothetical protein
MSFEIVPRLRSRVSVPRVTINRLGRFNINSSATKMLKITPEVAHVFLLWDKTTNRVGIKPLLKGDQRSYPLKVYGKQENSGSGFSAVSFLRYINYDFSKTRAFPVEWKDSMLVFDITSQFGTFEKAKFRAGGNA